MKLWGLGRGPRVSECNNVARRLQAYLDREMVDDPTAANISLHLEACRECEMEARTFTELKDCLRRLEAQIDPATLDRLNDFAIGLCDEEDPGSGRS